MSGIPVQDGGIWNSAVGGDGQGLPRHLLECGKPCRGGGRRGRLCGSRSRRRLARRDHWLGRKPGSSHGHGDTGAKESRAVFLETQRAALPQLNPAPACLVGV